MERFVIVPNEKDTLWGKSLLVRATEIASQVSAQNISALIGEAALRLAEKKDDKSETEIVLWGRAQGQFRAAWTSNAPQSDVVEVAVCHSDQGLVAEVFSTESAQTQAEPILQASVFTNLGDRRGKPVAAMRGVPIPVFGHCVGVLTWVGYGKERPPSGADNEVFRWAMIFARFSELRILKMSLGLEADP